MSKNRFDMNILFSLGSGLIMGLKYPYLLSFTQQHIYQSQYYQRFTVIGFEGSDKNIFCSSLKCIAKMKFDYALLYDVSQLAWDKSCQNIN